MTSRTFRAAQAAHTRPKDVIYRDNGKEKENHRDCGGECRGKIRDNGKEHGKYHAGVILPRGRTQTIFLVPSIEGLLYTI